MINPMLQKRPLVAALAVLGALATANAHAAGTTAGTVINNTATVSYTDSNTGAPATTSSNTTAVQVDEILGVTVTANNAGATSVSSPANDVPVCFTITNPGNGSEAYALTVNSSVSGDQYDPTDVKIYIDTDGNGSYTPGTDVLYVSGTNNPTLAPDATAVVCVTADTPAGRANGDLGNLSLTATAVTGSGAPGTTFAGQGTGGSDAVVGTTTATATATSGYQVTQLTSTLVKSQSVLDPFGGSNAVPGAIITYTLTMSLTGSGTLQGSVIADTIPANTTYVANSITLAAAALTDASDADAGSFGGSAIQVALGNVVATGTTPVTKVVTFKVRIN